MPFGAKSTAEEVATGVDLSGKVAVITGATSGIGKETARVLAEHGARVILACRDVARAQQVAEEIRNTENCKGTTEVIPLDLGSLASIHSFVETFRSENIPLHFLVNNAGISGGPRTQTQDGFEQQFGVNHLGHFLLTGLLIDILLKSAPARIICVSSMAHKWGEMKFDDLMGDRSYEPYKAYWQSKLANLLFARELARRLKGTGVTVFAVHPGVILTDLLQRHLGLIHRFIVALYRKKTVAQGAATSVWAITSPSLEGLSGLYLEDCKISTPSARSQDDDSATRLWTVSEQLVNYTWKDIVMKV
mmetsp:Transcript_35758/g.57828  ORF Transcript_35758/g.57828 Transcript_35758/m.57828 type:complete len:305 (+) Transcript_35758:1723-2637(+)